jgi:hypothetical protein
MTCTLMSSEVHRILTIEPERSAVGEQGRSQTACRHDFPATNAPSSDTKAGDSGASILQMASPCADGQRPSSLTGPAPRRNVRSRRLSTFRVTDLKIAPNGGPARGYQGAFALQQSRLRPRMRAARPYIYAAPRLAPTPASAAWCSFDPVQPHPRGRQAEPGARSCMTMTVRAALC